MCHEASALLKIMASGRVQAINDELRSSAPDMIALRPPLGTSHNVRN